MSKVKIHEFDFGIYPRKLWIAITTDNKFDGFSDLSEMDDSCDAMVDNAHDNLNNKGGIFIRFSNKKAMTTENIAHESVHVALEVFSYIEARIDYQNQELFCYLVGYIAKCCEQVKLNKFDNQ